MLVSIGWDVSVCDGVVSVEVVFLVCWDCSCVSLLVLGGVWWFIAVSVDCSLVYNDVRVVGLPIVRFVVANFFLIKKISA